jgi:hypothetical protein
MSSSSYSGKRGSYKTNCSFMGESSGRMNTCAANSRFNAYYTIFVSELLILNEKGQGSGGNEMSNIHPRGFDPNPESVCVRSSIVDQ